MFRDREEAFEATVLPRLSSGDESLWSEFDFAVSRNRPNDPARSADLFRTLPTRGSAQTHLQGYDFVLLVPVHIDNVHPPSIPQGTSLGIDVQAEYRKLIERMCAAYTARWHM